MRRGDIYFIKTLGNGSVQHGIRPVIVVQNDIGNLHSPTTIVCPITATIKKNMPTHVDIGTNGGLRKHSTVLCEQIRTINKCELRHYVGNISKMSILKALDKALTISLGIKE